MITDEPNIPEHVAIIMDGNGRWAKSHKIEFVAYLPNYRVFGKKAPSERDKEMVDACDIVFAFWDGKSTGTLYTIQYAKSIGRKCIVHIIQDLD